jgi:hypothetical protein
MVGLGVVVMLVRITTEFYWNSPDSIALLVMLDRNHTAGSISRSTPYVLLLLPLNFAVDDLNPSPLA